MYAVTGDEDALPSWTALKRGLKAGTLSPDEALDHPAAQDRLVVELLLLASLSDCRRGSHHHRSALAERTLFVAGLDPAIAVADLTPRRRAVLLRALHGPDRPSQPAPAIA